MSVRFSRLCLAMVLGCGLSVSVASAAMIEIVRKDGNKFTAELVSQTPSSVTVKISGIEQTIARDQIESMAVKQTLEEEFNSKRAALKDDDLAGRYDLAREYYDRGSVDAMKLAQGELESILRSRPDDAKAKLLRNVIEGKLKAAEKPADEKPAPAANGTPKAMPATPTAPAAPAAPAAAPAAKAASTTAPRMLTKEEINLIRVYEIDLVRDKGSVPQLSTKAMGELFEKYGTQPAMSKFLGPQGQQAFRKLDGVEQLKIVFDLQARDMYDQFIVRRDPPAMQNYVQNIHGNFVVRYCGSCHGEGKAPGLYIVTKNPGNEQTAYTNYMLLRRTVSGGFPLIYKQEPAKSPLLQYALPEKATTTGHPKVANYKPLFQRGADDPMYQRVLEWIKQVYGQGNEDYPIQFSAPGASSAPAEPPKPATPSPATPATPAAPAKPATPGAK